MKITVLGDPICDHNLYSGLRPTPDSAEERGLCETLTDGGSVLLRSLIEATVKACADDLRSKILPPVQGIPDCEVTFIPNIPCSDLPDRCHAYALWEPQPSNLLESDPEKRKLQVWRAAEPPLGYGRHEAPKKEIAKASVDPNSPASAATPFSEADADVLVIDDAGLDFRKQPLQLGRHQWVVMKLTGSIGEGALWKSLEDAKPENLVIILSADQLRYNDLHLDRALSWEATLQDLLSELAQNSALARLTLARHLIVTFRSDAALWIPQIPAKAPATSDGKSVPAPRPVFIFDGERAEGEWRTAIGPGVVFGYLSCFTTAIVQQLCLTTHQTNSAPTAVPSCTPDFEAALIAGLTASRALHRLGHGYVQPDIIKNEKTKFEELSPEPGFPFESIADAILKSASNPEKFATATLPAVLPDDPDWMLLDEWHVHAETDEHRRPYFDAAFGAAILGPGSLERFPVARFGDLRTVDRHEIEGLRIIRQAMQDYHDGGRQKKPLNLGVFGPPGAGKSFGVEQIVKAVFGDKAKNNFLTFNLSQFSSPDMLIDAFHQIRDKVVTGETPVAFWDEFDSESYKWLQYLLAPMNDGVFQQGPVTHPIGKCVFIFAGATSHSFDSFGPINPNDPDTTKILDDPTHPRHDEISWRLKSDASREKAENAWRDFILKKGPDFKSRLIATLDILGPNPRQRYASKKPGEKPVLIDDLADRCWPIRRAFFIRSQFGLKENARFEIDHGLLHALLEIPSYTSGSRSLEFICKHLRIRSQKAIPRRSHLPGAPLLARHVHAQKFREICECGMDFAAALTGLAEHLHEAYRLRIKGIDKKKNLDVPFDELNGDARDANLGQASRIPGLLRLAGLMLVKDSPIPLADLPAHRTTEEKALRDKLASPPVLELLSEAEHNGWMLERILHGWRHARIPAKDETKKLHPDLIPYSQLSEETKNYDRWTIIGNAPEKGKPNTEQFGLIEIVKTAGYRVINCESKSSL